MSKAKTSKIVKCKFSDTWENPKGETVYYHELTMENGDVYNCGTMEKYADKISEGTEITYTVSGNRLKLVQNQGSKAGGSEKKSTPKSQSGAKSNSGGYQRKPKQTDFLGYSYAYAKDMVVAGKTSPEDRLALREIAEEIYGHIGDILDGKTDPEIEFPKDEKSVDNSDKTNETDGLVDDDMPF